MSTSIGGKPGIKTIAAVQSQCRCWVIRCRAIQPQRRPLSVVGPIADKRLRRSERSDVPKAANAPQQKVALLDHLVGGSEQRRWHGKAERFGRFEVYHQLIFCRCLHGQVGWLLTLEDAINV
jgi:hypothetical protein